MVIKETNVDPSFHPDLSLLQTVCLYNNASLSPLLLSVVMNSMATIGLCDLNVNVCLTFFLRGQP